MSGFEALKRGPTLGKGRYSSVKQGSASRRSDVEQQVGFEYSINEKVGSVTYKKLESNDLDEKTFGDAMAHPLKTLHHESLVTLTDNLKFSLVLHFRHLKGKQNFFLDPDSADLFSRNLGFTQTERVEFNGIRDTDKLISFLEKIKREFSIKVHHKLDVLKEGLHSSEYDPRSQIVNFNKNFYAEFKPKGNPIHTDDPNHLPPGATRRPFFRYPEPDLSADIGVESTPSWLELFYDLFYVASLSHFTHSHHIKDWESLGLYTQWFVITWWGWCASSLYTARFDTNDVVHHIYKLTEMCAVIGMAGSSSYFLHSPGYIYGYIVLKAVLVIEYFVVFVVAVRAKSKSRFALSFYVAANLLSIGMWATSLVLIDREYHRFLWYLGILCEISVNIIVRGDRRLSWAASHFAERLGLFSLIVLGENLIGLVTKVSEVGVELVVFIANALAVFIIFGFFFMYFEDFSKEIFLYNKYHQFWAYLHFPLHLCQIAFGIALIDILGIYKYQLIKDHKLIPQEDASHGTKGAAHLINVDETATSTTATETDPSSSTNSHSKRSSDVTTENSESSFDYLKIKRDALLEPTEESYNPMRIMLDSPEELQLNLEQETQTGWKTGVQALMGSMVVGAFQLMTQSIDSGSDSHSHLERRAPDTSTSSDQVWAEDGFSESMTSSENVFVYKSFLIFAGAIIIINALIKAINSKMRDIYGKIIIFTRIVNAIALWSMCALPFSKLSAIVLLYSLAGSLIFLSVIDLLD